MSVQQLPSVALIIVRVFQNRTSAKHEADLKLRSRLLPELYDTRSNHYSIVSITNFGIKNAFEELRFENCRKHCEGSHQSARNWLENQVGIQLQVSNYKKFKSDTCNWKPTWSRVDYVANRRAENQSRLRILL